MEPLECQNLIDIRNEIDTLDQNIILLIGKRFEYVKAATNFKKSEKGVRAPDRFMTMLKQRRTWAEQSGLNPDVIEKMYTDLVNYFIAEELKHWKDKP